MKKSDKNFFRRLKFSKIKKDFIELVEGITFKEILILLSFPIFLTILMFLPTNLRDSLSLHIYNPEWWQFFTSSFIHENLTHLLDNIQTYFVISFTLLIFGNKTRTKKNFFILFLFTLISLPLISSLIEVLIYPYFIPNIKTSKGSSVLISSMFGFFPMFWIYYFSKKQKNNMIDKFFNLSLSYLYPPISVCENYIY
jgi:membrane associated rhomboid family serine protease